MSTHAERLLANEKLHALLDALEPLEPDERLEVLEPMYAEFCFLCGYLGIGACDCPEENIVEVQ